jgi:PAS domain S-box-containing protein
MDTVVRSRDGPGHPVATTDEQRFRQLAENASDLVYLYRMQPEPGFEYVSPSANRITGYSPREFCADPDLLIRIAHPHDQDLAAALLRAPTAFPEALVIRLIHRNGEVVWTEHTVAPIVDTTSSVVAVEGMARDITERAEAESELWKTVQTLRRTEDERRRLLGMLIEAEERERSRLAADLHDDTVQVLSASVLRLETLRRNYMADWARGELEGIEGTLRHAVERLRSRIFDLLPPTLGGDGLAAALRSLLDKMSRDMGIATRLEVASEQEPEHEVGAILYRIALEALTNVRKHAAASRIVVELEDDDNEHVLRIEDDGVGFVVQHEESGPDHFGVRGMRERARLLGGKLSVSSSPGAGTLIEVRAPRNAP